MKLYEQVLTVAGYDCEPTEENVIKCFLDYADTGVFGNLEYEEAKELIEDGEISMKQICSNIINVCR